MILITDTQYENDVAVTAGIVLENWKQKIPTDEFTTRSKVTSEYIPGQLYLRELPGILELLKTMASMPTTIVIDGFVFLDGVQKPGLGAYLFDALDRKTDIIGVAKNKYRDIPEHHAIYRGKSKRALWVTSAGIELETAQSLIQAMAGEFRLPDMIKQADSLARSS